MLLHPRIKKRRHDEPGRQDTSFSIRTLWDVSREMSGNSAMAYDVDDCHVARVIIYAVN
jgi:hypothetical protein